MAILTLDEEKEYHSLDEYFADHPEEEAGYYDDLAEMNDDFVEYPEDYTC